MKMAKMNSHEFEIFRGQSTTRRSEYHEHEFGMNAKDALAKAQEEFSKHSPQGLETKDQFFYNLILDGGVCAGYLWYGIRERANSKRLFIYDILVEEKFRGQGLSKFVMSWLEDRASEMGIQEIALHVLGANKIARSLYEKMGYEVTNLDMAKKINLAL